MKNAVIILICLLLVGCPELDLTDPAKPPTPIPDDVRLCEAVENKLKELQCKDKEGKLMWNRTSDESFSVTCKVLIEAGLIRLNLKCMMEEKTCKGINQCPKL